MEEWDEFGQKVDLTARIREVLLGYPEGTAILKELVQNADDAAARTVKFCLDYRQHPAGSLAHQGLADFQGPALLVYNDATFTAADLQSISRIGDSIKRTQSGKTGRFGIGFSSIYHLSDVPSFVTGSNYVIFDPHCTYLNVSSANPGKKVDFPAARVREKFPDQCAPWLAFGCDMRRPFPATLFRFPLRTEAQAVASKISKQVYNVEKMAALLQLLQKEAVEVLLFLKSVENLEVLDWHPGQAEPTLRYSCRLQKTGSHLRAQRFLFQQAAKGEAASIESFYDATFVTKDQSGSAVEESHRFLIGQACGDASMLARAAEASTALGGQVVPWGAVCAPLNSGPLIGKAFCFLSLLETALPIHINGYFELSANRRDVWAGTDMKGVGRMRAEWNVALLEEVIGPLYARLLVEMTSRTSLSDAHLQLWPASLNLAEPWATMVRATYRSLADLPVLRIEAGRWIRPSEAVLVTGASQRDQALIQGVSVLGIPAVVLPHSILQMLLDHTFVGPPNFLTPTLVRAAIRKDPTKARNPLEKVIHLATALLAFCMSDIDDTEPYDLIGLPLLPNMTGGLQTLEKGQDSAGLCVVTPLERKLLQSAAPDLLLDSEACGREIADRLMDIAKRGLLNLRCLNDALLAAVFLPRCLPAAWKDQVEVNWSPGANGYPSREWMRLLWEKLQEYAHLRMTRGWPVMPTSSNTLVHLPALKESWLVLKGGAGEWPEGMEETLLELNCRVVDPASSFDHPSLSKYVHFASGNGVALALTAAFALRAWDGAGLTAAHMRQLSSFLIQERWFMLQGYNKSAKDALSKALVSLPIFELAASPLADASRQITGPQLALVNAVGTSATTRFVSLQQNKQLVLAPLQALPGTLTALFLAAANDDQRAVLKKLGVRELGLAEFYREHVLARVNSLEASVRDASTQQMLLELPKLLAEDPKMAEVLRSTAFVPVGKGGLKAPRELYDPRHVELHGLLDAESSFPAGEFGASKALLAALQQLGMQSAATPASVLEMAYHVQTLASTDPDAALARARHFLSYLEREAGRLFPPASSVRNQKEAAAKFWAELANISWCPVVTQAPTAALPWPAQSSSIAAPSTVRPARDLWLVSNCMHILDGGCRSEQLEAGLGWNSPPPGSIIAAQLAALGAKNTTCEDKETSQALAQCVPQLYKALTALEEHNVEVATTVLAGAPVIFVGGGFVAAERVALRGPLSLAPRLYVLPGELAPFRDLFVRLGVPEHFKGKQYAALLADLAHSANGQPLQSSELEQAITIVQALSDSGHSTGGQTIYVPNSQGVLFPATEAIFNDAPWVPGEVHNFVHPKLSHEVSERVGVGSLRRRMLATSADSMDLGFGKSGVESFGQSESLSTRLKAITDAYVDGPGVLHELLQNADDAGASEVAFMLDNAEYGINSILGPNMAQWQGPALICWNDQMFSPADFQSISRIGQNSKLDYPLATGHKGLGFNAIYGYTDLPQFVSGEFLVAFDPHARFLPGISPAQPGLKIAFSKGNLPDQFPDAFAPFTSLAFAPFNCSLKGSYKHTLFRFPLRTEAAAKLSEISPRAFKPEDIMALFEAFQGQAAKTLLFLKNVHKISVYTRSGAGDGKPELLFQSKLTPEMGAKRPQAAVVQFIGESKRGSEDFFRRLAKTPASQLPSSCSVVTISTRLGSSGKHKEKWLICNALAGGRALEIASRRGKGHMPWVGAAARLPDSSPLEQGPLTGEAFTFLPLGIQTGFPVFLNASFALSSNRRNIWFDHETVGEGAARTEWNKALLEDGVAAAYERLIIEASKKLGPTSQFFSLWPTGDVAAPWSFLQRSVFAKLADLPVMWSLAGGGKWLRAADAKLPDEACKAAELATALTSNGFQLASVPQHVVSAALKLMPGAQSVTPASVRQHYAKQASGWQQLPSQSIKDAELLLAYCMSDIDATKAAQIANLPFVAMVDGTLSAVRLAQHSGASGKELFVLTAEDASLLSKQAHQIVHWKIGTELGDKLAMLARTGVLHLRLLDASALAQSFLPSMLPADWYKEEQVTWTPGTPGQPSNEWMFGLWKLMGLLPATLEPLESWPLLPAQGGLCRLSLASFVMEEGSWAEGVGSALRKLGCRFVDSSLSPHLTGQARDYIHQASGAGVLRAVGAATSNDIGKLSDYIVAASLTSMEREQLRTFLVQARWFEEGAGMAAEHLMTLRALPIFEMSPPAFVVRSTGPREPSFTHLLEMRALAPQGVAPGLLCGSGLVVAGSAGEAAILREHLHAPQKTFEEFMRDHVFRRIQAVDPDARDAAMLTLLQDPQAQGSPLLQALADVAFVPIAGGKTAKPSELYDPSDPELRALLDDSAFPVESFAANPEVLRQLRALGLRKEAVPEVLLAVAKDLGSLTSADEKAKERAKALLSQLDKLAQKEAQDGSQRLEWGQLISVPWCPVIRQPEEGLPMVTLRGFAFAPPERVCLKADAVLASATKRSIDGSVSAALSHRLGWDALGVPVLVEQLAQLGKMHPQVDDPPLRSRLGRVVGMLYAALSMAAKDPAATAEVHQSIGDQACIWMGSGFLDAQAVVLHQEAVQFDMPADLASKIQFVVPEDLARKYRSLLVNVLKVDTELSAGHCIRGLVRLEKMHHEVPLPEGHLGLCRQLVEELAMLKQVGQPLRPQPFLPDHARILRPAGRLYFNDAEWLESEGVDGLYLVNELISSSVAADLGVLSLRAYHQLSTTSTSNLACPPAAALAKELDRLPSEAALVIYSIAELADAASADCMHVFLDERAHPSQSLLHHGFAAFQGPALCFYIPGMELTAEELTTLQLPQVPFQLRNEDCTWGTGLLTSYLVSDMPQMLSGDSLYVFDPCGCGPIASGRGGTGWQYKHVGSDLPSRFSDQFASWDFSELDITQHTRATLIRLPLRTPAQAKRSAVSKVEWDVAKVKAMLEAVAEPLGRSLLFQRCLCSVRIARYAPNTTEPVLLSEVSTVTTLPTTAARVLWSREDWDKQGLMQSLIRQPRLNRAFSMKLRVNMGEGSSEQIWRVFSTNSYGATRDIALRRENEAYRLDPSAAVAVCLTDSGHVKPSYGVFAPFPVLTKPPELASSAMPFILYGKFSLDGQRRALLPKQSTDPPEQSDDTPEQSNDPPEQSNHIPDARDDFNKELLLSGVLGAWLEALQALLQSGYAFIAPNTDAYSLIPSKPEPGADHPTLVSLFEAMITKASQRPLWQLRVGGRLSNLRDGCFMPEQIAMGERALAVVQRAMDLFAVPWRCKEALEAAGIQCKEMSPAVLRSSLKQASLQSFLINLNAEQTAELLAFCLSDLWEPEGQAQPPAGAATEAGEATRLLNWDKAATCRSLPVSDAYNRVVQLSRNRLFSWSPANTAPPADVFLSQDGRDFLHPKVVLLVGHQLQDPTLATVLNIKEFTFEDCNKLMEHVLPPLWQRHGLAANIFVTWNGGSRGGPDVAFMERIWAMLQQLHATCSQPDWSQLGTWPLVPLRSGNLLCLDHRALVFTPPPAAIAAPQAAQARRPAATETPAPHAKGPGPDGFDELVAACIGDSVHISPRSPGANSQASSLVSSWTAASAEDAAHLTPRSRAAAQGSPVAGTSGVHPHQVQPSEDGSSSGSLIGTAEPQVQQRQLGEVQEPWCWLLPLLERFQLPVLDARFAPYCEALCNDTEELFQHALIRKLHGASSAHLFEVERLSNAERKELFSYMIANMPAVDGPLLEFLASMPIYPSLAGSRVAATGVLGSCPENRLQAVACSAEDLPAAVKASLLEHAPQHTALFELLEIPDMREADILMKVIIPNLDSLQAAAVNKGLGFLVGHWDTLKANEGLREMLSAAPFVTAGDGKKHKPCELYDPSLSLLARVFNGQLIFPSGVFAEPRWLEVLRDLGVKTRIDQQAFISMVQRIEAQAFSLKFPKEGIPCIGGESETLPAHEDLWQTAAAVASYLRDNSDSLHGADLYATLKKIAFVPAFKGVPGNRTSKRVLTSYGQAVEFKHWPLAWMAASILAPEHTPRPHTWTPLGLRSPPMLATVMTHLKEVGKDGGEECLGSWPTQGLSVEQAFSLALKYLAEQGLADTRRNQLRDARFIPVANNTQLVAPSRLFARLKEDMAPFAFEVPPAFIPHLPLLKDLGTRDEPMPADMLSIIQSLRSAYGGARLNVNELRSVLHLLSAACTGADFHMQLEIERLRKRGELLVPGLQSSLIPAHRAIHALTAPRALLQRVDEERIPFVHPQVSPRICMLLAIPALEDAVCEVLDNKHDMQAMEQQAQIQGKSCGQIKNMLASPELAHAIHALIHEYLPFMPALRAFSLREIRAALALTARKLCFVASCRTRLLLKSASLDVTGAGGAAQVYAFEDEEQAYVAVPPEGVKLETVLSQLLSRVLRSPVPLPLDSLLACHSNQLATLQQAFSMGPPPSGLQEAERAGKLGELLLERDAALVQLKPLRPFTAGELCAMKAPPPAAEDAAAAAAERRLSAGSSTEPGRLVYVRVVNNARPEPGKPVFRVIVEVAPADVRHVHSSDLYSFRAGNSLPRDRGNLPTRSSLGQTVAQPLSAASSSGSPGPSGSGQQESAPSAADMQGSHALPAGVGANDVAQAVREMLAAAGMPVDLERGQLLELSLKLQESLESTQHTLNATKQEAEEAKGQAEAASEAWTCKICSSMEVNAFLSCGHTGCTTCLAQAMPDGRCPFCRRVASVTPIFK